MIGKLRTQGLIKKYGKKTVVNNVSIEVNEGEIVGLLGPNGAGKTTTFYMTIGIIKPTEGKVFLSEKDITLSYIKQIDIQHDKFLIEKHDVFENIKNVPILTLDCNKDFENNEQELQKHIYKLKNFLEETSIKQLQLNKIQFEETEKLNINQF